jgi:hypothetical protein
MIYDFISIRAVFGASVTSRRLVGKGLRVLPREQGRRYNSYHFPKSNRNLRKDLWIPALRFFGFQKLTSFSQTSILSEVGGRGGGHVHANTLIVPKEEFFKNESWSAFKNWKSNGS